MEITTFADGSLRVRVGDQELCYLRTPANQLILCARMNDWDRFTAMWKRKTDAAHWPLIETEFNRLDPTRRWKLKETFARLTTVDEAAPSPTAT